jgi:hypothetical protein
MARLSLSADGAIRFGAVWLVVGCVACASSVESRPDSATPGGGDAGVGPSSDASNDSDAGGLRADSGASADASSQNRDDGGTTDAGAVAFDECARPARDWLFCSGFEEADWKTVWDDGDGNPEPANHVLVDRGPSGNAANHVMRLRAPQGAAGGADLVKVVQSHDRLYARWYVAYEPGFNFDAKNHGSGLFAGDRNDLGQSGIRPSGSDFFQVTFDYALGSDLYPHTWRSYAYYRGMYQDCAGANGECWGDSLPCEFDTGQTFCTEPQDLPNAQTPHAPTLVAGKWYCFEMMIDGGTPSSSGVGANGGLDYWVDGVELAPSQMHHWMRTTASVQPSILWLLLYHHDGAHSVEGVYYDNVVVSTTRIGCR